MIPGGGWHCKEAGGRINWEMMGNGAVFCQGIRKLLVEKAPFDRLRANGGFLEISDCPIRAEPVEAQ